MNFTNALPPRHYKTATVAIIDYNTHVIQLDGRELLTPARAPLHLPSAALAIAIAAEWNAQATSIDPATMPLSQLVMTAVDRVAPQRPAVETALVDFLSTELVCHAGEGQDLRDFQLARWRPVRDWAQAAHGVALPVTTGLSPVIFDTGWARDALAAMDIWQLTAAQQAASLYGSLAIALALLAGAVTAPGALDAAEAEGDFQAGRWGEDPAATSRRAGLLREAQGIATFIDLLKEV